MAARGSDIDVARLMEGMPIVREIVGTSVRSETCRVLVWCRIVFRFGFSDWIQA